MAEAFPEYDLRKPSDTRAGEAEQPSEEIGMTTITFSSNTQEPDESDPLLPDSGGSDSSKGSRIPTG